MKRNIISLAIGIIVSLVIFEIYLRLFYPFPSFVKNGYTYLPTNAKQILRLNTKGLTEKATFTRNEIGLRGENPPKDLENYLSIITTGGSTTESHYQDDKNTWTNLLGEELKKDFDNIWINNAGIDGLSSYGIRFLLIDHILPLKPKVILFLMSTNDVGLEEFRKYDVHLLSDRKLDQEIRFDPKKNFAIVTFVENLLGVWDAKKKGLLHNFDPLEKFEHTSLSQEERNEIIKSHGEFISHFKERLEGIIEITRKEGAEPIFITEPTLLGDVVDPTTGIDLSTIKHIQGDGSSYWSVLQLYHQAMKDVGENQNVHVIDLGSQMPKDSKYFYDVHHYTDAGALKVKEIVYKELEPILAELFSEFKE